MSGKKLTIIVVTFLIIALIATWLYAEKIIVDFDIDRAIESNSSFVLYEDQHIS